MLLNQTTSLLIPTKLVVGVAQINYFWNGSELEQQERLH